MAQLKWADIIHELFRERKKVFDNKYQFHGAGIYSSHLHACGSKLSAMKTNQHVTYAKDLSHSL